MATDTKHVRNVSGITQEVIGVGIVEADATIEVPADFNNANFEDAKAATPKPKKDEKETKED